MTKRILCLVLFAIPFMMAMSQTALKREFRGAWIALVRNEDWPSKVGLSTEQQQYELKIILDELQSVNINAVFFQIRPECDAIYQSSYEPWSYWLTGEQGKAPDPFYDPLQFALDEAHKRGMEFHAWFNPYRAVSVTGRYEIDSSHISITKPEWIIDINGFKFLNPGLPEVREYTVNVIMEVTKNYDIDGVHLDDYFYPYPNNQITTQDQATFNLYPRGFTDINNWRRDNVNLLIKMIGESAHAEKPYIKYGVSPFGIWKNGVPAGITGLDAYNVIFCDAVAWMDQQLVDYLIPQLYWAFGGQQDYGTLLPWWASKANGKHLYSGMGFYKGYAPSEYGNQINLNRANTDCQGEVFFKASNFINNQTVTNYLKENHFSAKSLLPQMDWRESTPPNAPSNLVFHQLENERGYGLVWDKPAAAGDGDFPFMYAVYQLDSVQIQAEDLEDASRIKAISGVNSAAITKIDSVNPKIYFGVTSLDRNYNESSLSEIIEVNLSAPSKSVLEFPLNGAINQPEDVMLRWHNTLYSTFNRVQISDDSLFTNILFEKEGVKDTFIVVNGFTGQTKYFWRVSSSNFMGDGEFSDTWSFKTGFPIPPVLSEPADKATMIIVRPTFKWYPAESSDSYNCQLYYGSTISPNVIVLDTVLTDTTVKIMSDLQYNRVYTWRVSSANNLGFGGWSTESRFKTELETGVDEEENIPNEFWLYQNYPNPFNPSTTIKFTIPLAEIRQMPDGVSLQNVTLKIFDILGREVATVLEKEIEPGVHEVNFDAGNLSSGVYFYTLKSGINIQTKKMILLR
ncbi:MAG: family 10 glycosylhydrolase [Bacteroidetes bacterium]|nr:family 10 glycosylhydrolase [Bacteroidota bacterium]